MKLFCLPYAGGGSGIYREWPARLAGSVEVIALELPGRGRKRGLPPLHEWAPLLSHLLDEMAVSMGEPFALFGHSMGALLAYELSCALRQRRGIEPVWLGVSACVAPNRRAPSGEWMSCDEGELIEEIRRLQGTPEKVLSNRDLLDLVLPSLRADFHLCGTYRYRHRSPLASALSVFVGNRDAATLDPASVRDWMSQTRGRSSVYDFDADHFFIHDKSAELTAAVRSELQLAQTALDTRARAWR